MKDKTSNKYTENWYCFTLRAWLFFEVITQANVSRFLGIDITIIDNMITGLVLCSITLLCFFGQSYSKKEIVVISLITILISAATINSHMNTLLSAWMFIVAAKNIDFYKIVQSVNKILIITISLIIALNLMGAIPENVIYRNGAIRHSLGFSHPNQLALRIFQLSACYCYLRWERITIFDGVIMSMFLLFVSKITDSQTASICISLLFILVIFMKWGCKKFNDANVILGTIYWGIGLISAVISISFTLINVKKYSILSTFDQLLSLRFSEGYKVYKLYGISMLGQRIYVTASEREAVGLYTRLWLDSAYCNLLIRMGIIVFLLFCIGYFFTFYKMKNVPVIAVIFLVYAVYGIMEGSLTQLTHNIFLITMAWSIYPEKTVEQVLMNKGTKRIIFKTNKGYI